MTQHELHEFLVTVAAILLGFIIAKQAARYLNRWGVPISAGDPMRVIVPTLPAPTATAQPAKVEMVA